ncbi:MAG TPA: hypothetical protein VLF79_03185 [Candidatus Saccharimonadales bacterium]|nr:hypothetical protein [Candidatus Saccharimonadales bacterium]
MKNKGLWWVIGIIIVIILIIGGYAIFHNSSNTSTESKTTSNGQTTTAKNSIVVTKTDPQLGHYLADSSGKTLYIYKLDSGGESKCTGSCLATWPAYIVKGSTNNLPTSIGFIKRSDTGQNQYTYNGQPLYYFVSDSVGKVTGNNVENFVVATPTSASSSSSSSSTTTNNSNSSTTNTNSSSSSSSSGYPY